MLAGFGCLAFTAQAQVLDDTTKIIYGPSTTRYILEEDLRNDLDKVYTLDSTVSSFHRYDFVEKTDVPYQDLGNLGTAMQPVFYNQPDELGQHSGFNSFSAFGFDPNSIRYFNTRSPYTYLDYVQGGGRKRQMLRTGISRNIIPEWNVGLDYQRMTSLRQIGVPQQRDLDKLMDNHAVVVHTNYVSKDRKYRVLLNYTHMNHLMYESGGILPTVGDSIDDLFDYELEMVRLGPQARTRDLRNGWHLYQQYKLNKGGGIQIYHLLERKRQRNSYSDPAVFSADTSVFNPNGGIYQDTLLSDSATSHRITYTAIENTLGLKGRLSGFQYGLYVKRRDLSYKTPYESFDFDNVENYGGGSLRYDFSERSYITAQAEGRLARDYFLRVEYINRWFTAEHRRMFYSPTLLQQFYSGNHFSWNNDFNLTTSDRTTVSANLKLGTTLEFKPFVENTLIGNYIYYNQEAVPQQTPGVINILAAGTSLSLRVGRFHTDNMFRYTTVAGPDVIRMPAMYWTGKFYYQATLFKGALPMQAGFDVRWHSPYLADAYMPVTSQFYLQDNFIVDPYPVVNVFINARIKRVSLFARFTHANQGLERNGYFVTPYYVGQQRIFEFGVRWSFFD
jgi:hypothetical protein